MDFLRPRVPLPAAALLLAHAGGRGAGLPAGLGARTSTARPAPRTDLPAELHLLRQRGSGQPGAEPGAAGRGSGRARHRPAGHPAVVGAAAGPPAPPAAIRGHGTRLRRGGVQHRRRCSLPPARGLRPPGCHRPACPQVAAAKPAAAGGPPGRRVPAVPHRPAQLLPALRGSRGAGGGPGVAGRAALRRLALGLRAAQLPGLRPLQPGQLLRPVPHLRPHHPPPGQHHGGGQPPALPPALRQQPERAQLPGHRADAGRDVHVPAATAHRTALGGVAAAPTPPAPVGDGGGGTRVWHVWVCCWV